MLKLLYRHTVKLTCIFQKARDKSYLIFIVIMKLMNYANQYETDVTDNRIFVLLPHCPYSMTSIINDN